MKLANGRRKTFSYRLWAARVVGILHLPVSRQASKTAGGYCILNLALGMRTEAEAGFHDMACLRRRRVPAVYPVAVRDVPVA